MTPFGSLIDFKKGNETTNQSSKIAKNPVYLDVNKATSDFDSFLLGFDQKNKDNQQIKPKKRTLNNLIK